MIVVVIHLVCNPLAPFPLSLLLKLFEYREVDGIYKAAVGLKRLREVNGEGSMTLSRRARSRFWSLARNVWVSSVQKEAEVHSQSKTHVLAVANTCFRGRWSLFPQASPTHEGTKNSFLTPSSNQKKSLGNPISFPCTSVFHGFTIASHAYYITIVCVTRAHGSLVIAQGLHDARCCT